MQIDFTYNSQGHLYEHGLTLILAWISDNIHYNVWDEIIYPLPNLNGCMVWEWISNPVPHFYWAYITDPC